MSPRHTRAAAAMSAVLVGVVAAGALGAPLAVAYWTRGNGSASATAATLGAPGVPTATGSRTLTIAWDAPASASTRPVRYIVERRPEAADAWTAVCGTDVAAMTGRVCTDTPAAGGYRYRVRASLGSWTSTGLESAAVTVAAVTAGATSSASTGAAGATSLTVPVPASVAVGELLVVQVAFDRGTDAGSDASLTPAGWTLATRANRTNSFGQAVLWRRATVADVGGTVTIPFARTVRAAAGLVAFAGVGTSTPLGAVGAASGSSATLQAPSVDGTGGAVLVVLAAVKRQGVTFGVPTAMSTTTSFENAQDVSAVQATQTLTVAGQTGVRTVTASQSGDWVAQSLVLRAA